MDKNKEKIEELVANAKEGNAEAFGEVYDFYSNQIYKYVYYRVKKEDVEDLVEIVFLRAWENLSKYSKGKFSFSAWLFRIAHNLVVDYYRSHEVPVSLDEEMEEVIQDYSADREPRMRTERKLNSNLLKTALDSLSKPFHDIIILKFVNGMENDEISKILGKSEASIRVMQFRALKELRKTLNYYEFDV